MLWIDGQGSLSEISDRSPIGVACAHSFPRRERRDTGERTPPAFFDARGPRHIVFFSFPSKTACICSGAPFGHHSLTGYRLWSEHRYWPMLRSGCLESDCIALFGARRRLRIAAGRAGLTPGVLEDGQWASDRLRGDQPVRRVEWHCRSGCTQRSVARSLAIKRRPRSNRAHRLDASRSRRASRLVCCGGPSRGVDSRRGEFGDDKLHRSRCAGISAAPTGDFGADPGLWPNCT